jgi:hypothetical protein
LTSKITAAASVGELAGVLQQHLSSINHIHVAAAFKTLLELEQQQQQQQQQQAAVADVLLELAGQHAAAFTAAQKGHILWAVVQLQLHPGAAWYQAMLQQPREQQQLQQEQQQLGGQTEHHHLNEHSLQVGVGDAQLDSSSSIFSIGGSAGPVVTAGADARPVVYGKQLTQLLKHAGSPSELAVVLQCSWPALHGIQTVAVVQRLTAIQQQQQQQQQSLQDDELEVVQSLAHQLLQHAAELAAAAADTAQAASSTHQAHPQQQQQPRDSVGSRKLSAKEVAVILRGAAVLQPQDLTQPVQLLLQLLQHAAAGLSAAELSGAALVSVLQGAAWLMRHEYGEDWQQQQQQQQVHQQQQIVTQQPLRLEPVPAPGAPAVSPAAYLQPESQMQQRLQQKMQLLRTQQQQRLQQLQGPAWPGAAPPAAPTDSSQQQQEHAALMLQHIQQQQRQAQVQQLLISVISCCCQPGSVLQRQGLQLKQLAALLSLCADTGVVLDTALLVQLLDVAGISSSDKGSADDNSSRPQLQQRQQQQQQQHMPPGDAAAVLWQLAVLAERQQQQQQQQVASIASAVANNNSSNSSNTVIDSILQSHCLQQLLLAAAAASAANATAASHRGVCVALAAAAKLATVLDAVHHQQQQQARRSAAGSVETSRPHPAALPASHAATGGEIAGQKPSSISRSASLQEAGATIEVLQQLRDAVLVSAQPQQQQRQRQRLPGSQAAGALQSLQVLQQHLELHSHHHQQQLAASHTQGEGFGIEPQQQQQGTLLSRSWLRRFVVANQPQLTSTNSSCVSTEQLTYVLQLLQTHNAWQLPQRWYTAVEGAVLFHVQGLQHATAPRCTPTAAVQLLHAWVRLLMLQRQQQRRQHSAPSSGSVASDAAAAHNSVHRTSSSSSVMQGRRAPTFQCTAAFRAGVCAALQPQLAHLNPKILGLAAWAVATLGPADTQQWLAHLMPAVAAAAAAAAHASAGVPASAAVGSGIDTTTSSSSSSIAAATMPAQALLHILQSLVLLRCRPPLALLQQLLSIAVRDMALYRGSVLVGLLLVLVQLRVRPGAGWLRGLMLRAQGKLRMLSFDELTQVRECL